MRGHRVLGLLFCSLALTTSAARGQPAPSTPPDEQPDAPGALATPPGRAATPAPASEAAPAPAPPRIDDPYAACLRVFREMTARASATVDLHERGRLLLARPECSVGMRPPADAAAGARVPTVEVTRSYGNQTLVTDGVAVIAVVAGAGTGTRALGVVGVGFYLLGGPVVHLSHDRGGAAFGSLMLRAGLPLLGFAAGCGLDDGNGEFACLGGAAIGGLLGVVGAVVIDSAVLSNERVAVPAAGLQLGLIPRSDGGFAVTVGRRF